MKKDPFFGGIILSAAFIYDGHGQDGMAVELLMISGLTPEKIKNHGEEFDVDRLKGLFPELRRKLKPEQREKGKDLKV